MTALVTPIDDCRRSRVVQATCGYVQQAETIYGRSFAAIEVRFDLRGRTAGMYRVQGKCRRIRYNPWIFARYFAENLATTVPHEVAHYIIHEVHGFRRVRPHGVQWQALMAEFGADAATTFDYDLSGIPMREYRKFAYACRCQRHELTARRHNQVVRGMKTYSCRLCHGVITRLLEG